LKRRKGYLWMEAVVCRNTNLRRLGEGGTTGTQRAPGRVGGNPPPQAKTIKKFKERPSKALVGGKNSFPGGFQSLIYREGHPNNP